jgi:hypothetical protein
LPAFTEEVTTDTILKCLRRFAKGVPATLEQPGPADRIVLASPAVDARRCVRPSIRSSRAGRPTSDVSNVLHASLDDTPAGRMQALLPDRGRALRLNGFVINRPTTDRSGSP